MMLKTDLSVLVDWRLDCCSCMCTMVVALECGLYCCTCLDVSSGHESRKPSLMSLVQVETTGKKRAT